MSCQELHSSRQRKHTHTHTQTQSTHANTSTRTHKHTRTPGQPGEGLLSVILDRNHQSKARQSKKAFYFIVGWVVFLVRYESTYLFIISKFKGQPWNVNRVKFTAVSVEEPINTNQIKNHAPGRRETWLHWRQEPPPSSPLLHTITK